MGYQLVNLLGGLLIVTSTMVVISKSIKVAIRWYAVQSLILVGLLATLGNVTGASELLMWAVSAFVTKVVRSSCPMLIARWASRAIWASRAAPSRRGPSASSLWRLLSVLPW